MNTFLFDEEWIQELNCFADVFEWLACHDMMIDEEMSRLW